MIISGMDTSDVVALLNDYYSISNSLSRRGFDVKDIADTRDAILTTDRFYKNFKSFSYRQILKLIYDSEIGIDASEIRSKLSSLTQDRLKSLLSQLTEDKCIVKDDTDTKYKRASDNNYARTFEWFICEVFKRELKGIASSGVKILKLRCGGDFDVIARLEDLLVYIECKSGSVFNVSKDDISNFLERYGELAPSFAILIIDTNGLPSQFDRTFQQADWWGAHGLSARVPLKRRILHRGIFYEVIPRIHVVTNEGNLISNIKLSVNHFFGFVKPYGLIGPGPKYLSKYYDEYKVKRPKT